MSTVKFSPIALNSGDVSTAMKDEYRTRDVILLPMEKSSKAANRDIYKQLIILSICLLPTVGSVGTAHPQAMS